MKNAVILHGKPEKNEYYDPQFPSASNSHWIPWLQKQLLIHEISAHTPEIPHAFEPHYPTWKKELERFQINSETILVGHSCGAGFLVRWLSEYKDIIVGKVVLVAPWIDPERDTTTDFFDFKIDANVTRRTSGLTVFYSDNDYQSIQKTVQILRDGIVGVQFRKFHNYGHFTFEDMKTHEFPELLDALL